MAFRPEDLRWMVEESMTLSERLGGAVVPGGSGQRAGVAGTRLRKWSDRVANGDPARFEKRLRWDGLDVRSALRLVGPVRLKDPGPLPDWATFLDAASDTATPGSGVDRVVVAQDVFDRRAPQPFEDLLWRLIPEAARRLCAGLGPCRERLSPAALVDLLRGLLGRMCRTAARTLCAEFDVYRTIHPGHLSADRCEPGERGRQVYRDFVRAMSGAGFVAWLLRYPMLGRLLATCCQQWIAASVELVRRLDRDVSAIRATFGIQARPLRVVGVTPDLSDRHRGGRTVCVLTFGAGARLVYKPRRLALDRHFSDLLNEIAGTCHTLATRRLQVLDRGDYGWVEWVEAAPCADRAAVERFYRRAGMLTCLAYALGGSDLHADNVIASGEHPVLIDLECIVGAPLASPRRQDTAEPARSASPAGSVFRTGLPPAARRGANGVFRFVGGLADPDPRRTSGNPVAHTNTDWMAWRGSRSPSVSALNVPVLDGRLQCASAYVDPLIEGFRLMYGALGRKRARLGSADPVRRLEREEFRVLIRDTRSYAALMEDALAPQHVTSGPDWSIALDVLAAPTLAATERPLCWATRTAERVALERLDIPFFAGRMDQSVLRSSAGVRLGDVLDRTGYTASTRLAQLNADDLDQQLRLLRMSFEIAGVKRRYRERRVRAARNRGPETIRRQALVEVHVIVNLLKRLATRTANAITWYGLDGAPAASSRLDPVGVSLYSGTSGIALFLAAVAMVTARRDARELAARAFDPLCTQLGNRTLRPDPASDFGIGGATGLGGLIYALVRASRSLGNRSYIAAARAAADGITQAAIRADEALDVMSGAAGALLGLLVLHGTTGDRCSLQRAIWCGEHLLDRRTTDPDTGLRAWRRQRGRMATGFAHGTSGIAYALRRLGDTTGEGSFRGAATEAWTAESRRLLLHRESGMEHRPPTHESSASRPWSWCHGSAGIGLARLAALDDREARSDVEAAIEAAPGPGTVETDGLCCGRLGRADLLLSTGIRLGRRDLREAAVTLGRQTMTRALAEGRYATGTDEGFRPGLFQGLSGIGYELLRLQAADTVPSVLLWE